MNRSFRQALHLERRWSEADEREGLCVLPLSRDQHAAFLRRLHAGALGTNISNLAIQPVKKATITVTFW